MVKTICYGNEKTWKSREDAEAFFFEALSSTEGAEQLRYMNVYSNLRMGKDVATDTLND